MHDTRTGVNMLVPGDVKEFKIKHGPAIENLRFSNLVLDTKIAFYLWIGDEAMRPGGIRHVSISDVSAKTEDGCYTGGARNNWIEDLRLSNIALAITGKLSRSFGADVPYPMSVWGSWPLRQIPYAWFFRYVHGLSMDNMTVDFRGAKGRWLSALRMDEVSGLNIHNLITCGEQLL